MRYVPYEELSGRPNVIVDGSATDGTVLTLSHWPHSGTPPALMRDLSAEAAFAYVDRPDLHVAADLVSNNHLDEDGVVGVHTLVDTAHALAHRDLLVEIARAGDFGATSSRTAARIAFALATLANRADATYELLLAALPGLVAEPATDDARALWEEEDDHLAASLATPLDVEELTELDASVVRSPAVGALHPIALHNAVRGFTVLVLSAGRPAIEQRYESWVQYVTRRPRPRRDLRPLAALLTAEDGIAWSADPPSALVPVCAPRGESNLDPARIRELFVQHLQSAAPAWDPYD